MRRLLNILVCLTLFFSLGTTATAHAFENSTVSASVSFSQVADVAEGHAPGDADQVPADGDKGYPHHHGGCHGDHVAAPVKVGSAVQAVGMRVVPIPVSRFMRPLSAANPGLRPPKA